MEKMGESVLSFQQKNESFAKKTKWIDNIIAWPQTIFIDWRKIRTKKLQAHIWRNELKGNYWQELDWESASIQEHNDLW